MNEAVQTQTQKQTQTDTDTDTHTHTHTHTHTSKSVRPCLMRQLSEISVAKFSAWFGWKKVNSSEPAETSRVWTITRWPLRTMRVTSSNKISYEAGA